MVNKIHIIDPNNIGNLTATALNQLVPYSIKLPINSQNPAVTIIQSSFGSPVGISGYAQGYASIIDNNYNEGSSYFGNNVSEMTISQLIAGVHDSSVYYGAVQINYPILNQLISNNPDLYGPTTIFSPDIQSAMMTDLAIAQIPNTAISYAQVKLLLPGISDALAYYTARFNIDPLIILGSYNHNDLNSTMSDKFIQLKNQSDIVKNATVYAVVNGLSESNGGLGLFQGFNSWFLYPTNMTGTNSLNQPIQNVTLPGRGNNPGVNNYSQEPINAIAYELSQLSFLTQQSLQQSLQIISTLISVDASNNTNVLNTLSMQASNALTLTPKSASFTNLSQFNLLVIEANDEVEAAYNAYQNNISGPNPILAANLNSAISNYVTVLTTTFNLNNAVNGAFAKLSTGITPLSNVIISNYNSFPIISSTTATNSIETSSSNVTNTTVQGITLQSVSTPVSGNINTIIDNSTVPSLVTNPQLAMITVIGQNVDLTLTQGSNSTITYIGNQIYQVSTVQMSNNNIIVSTSSGSN